MKHNRREGDTGPPPALSPRKRLKPVPLPQEAQRQPKLPNLTKHSAMSPEEALHEAAATNQVQRLQQILGYPQFRDKMNETAQKLTEIAATHGHLDVIGAVYQWWDCLDARQKCEIGCGRANILALENGHFDAFENLQDLYNDRKISEVLNTAVENGSHAVVDTICKSLPCSRSLIWAAHYGRLEVVKTVLGQAEFDARKWRKSLYKAMVIAVDFGHFEIVKVLNETCGDEVFRGQDGDGAKEADGSGDDDEDEEPEEVEEEEDSDDTQEVDDNDCPLVLAIKKGRMDMVRYLYANNGYRVSSLEMVAAAAASNGPLEAVKLLDAGDVYAGASQQAFEFAAGGGQIDIMKFFQSKEDFDVASLGDALTMAASFGKADALTYLYSIKGFKPITASIEEAFTQAAGKGRLEVVKILNTTENISREVTEKAFARAVTAQTAASDQAGIVKYLFATGRISPSFIRSVFVPAAQLGSVEVVEFLYAKGSISPDMVGAAFVHAVGDNCSDVVTFLCSTGVLATHSVRSLLKLAILEGETYIVARLYNSGYVSREMMARESKSVKVGNVRTVRFIRQSLKKSSPEVAA